MLEQDYNSPAAERQTLTASAKSAKLPDFLLSRAKFHLSRIYPAESTLRKFLLLAVPFVLCR